MEGIVCAEGRMMSVGTNETPVTARGATYDIPRRDSVSPQHSAFERHYRVGELAEIWKLGRETVRLLVKDEQGVIKIRRGRKKAHTSYSVPESVAMRIHTRLLNSR
jgi:hypothetical protein